MLNVVIAIVTIAYPAFVYFGFTHLPSGVFAGGLIVLFGLRLWVARQSVQAAWVAPVAVAILIFAGIALLAQSTELLLYYPVIINLCLLAVFGYSLRHPPSVIERIARFREPDLPASGVAYTRKVTWVWCFFFASTPQPHCTPSFLRT
jgi:uncharacterized membrane protein